MFSHEFIIPKNSDTIKTILCSFRQVLSTTDFLGNKVLRINNDFTNLFIENLSGEYYNIVRLL